MSERVPIHMREQFARWEADFDLEKAQQMAAQVPRRTRRGSRRSK